jgi:uncharacterized protein
MTLKCASLLLLALALLWGGGPALAQTDAPAMGSPAASADAVQPEADTYQILVIGDALGGGLGAGVLRYAEANPGLDVTLRYVEESGIARPEVYDWSETLPKILEGKGYAAIVVMLGSNDRQMIKSENLRYGFNSPEWVIAYKAQMDKMLEEMAVSGAKVFWVSLPPMADPDYEAAMEVVTAIQKERVEARGMTFVDIRKAFLAADGSYTDTGPDDTGEIHKLRGRDGVSFFKQGNNLMAQLVMASINQERTAAPAPAAAVEEDTKADSETALAPKVPLGLPADEVPTFGQADLDGAAVLVKPVDVVVALATASNGSFKLDNGTLKEIIALTPPGSAAAKLFASGTAAAAPAGRVDDFTMPAPKP